MASPSPLYVLNIDAASHRVTVGADEELATTTLRANRLNWISIPELTAPMRVKSEDPPSSRAGMGHAGAGGGRRSACHV